MLPLDVSAKAINTLKTTFLEDSWALDNMIFD